MQFLINNWINSKHLQLLLMTDSILLQAIREVEQLSKKSNF